MKRGHIPRRVCVVCRCDFPKQDLIRLVKTGEGKILSGENVNLLGKGIYICRRETCIKEFIGGKKFKRLYHQAADEEVIKMLESICNIRETQQFPDTDG